MQTILTSREQNNGPLGLPDELLESICDVCDPVAFIAISQTCTRLRRVAAPTRHNFLQRLLCLELDPEEGGVIPTFTLRMGGVLNLEDPPVDLEPTYDSEAWKTMRYACAACLRLRPAHWFDAQSLARARFRKPTHPDSLAVELNDIVLRGDPARVWARRRAISAKYGDHEDALWRRQTALRKFWYTHVLRDFGVADIDGLSSVATLSVRLIRRYRELWKTVEEKNLVGMQRHRRLCIECHFARGDYNTHTKAQPRPLIGFGHAAELMPPTKVREGTVIIALRRLNKRPLVRPWGSTDHHSHPARLMIDPTDYVKANCGACRRWFTTLAPFGRKFVWEVGDWRCLECKTDGCFGESWGKSESIRALIEKFEDLARDPRNA